MIYDKYTLISAYLEAQEQNYLHDDFKIDAQNFLNILENAFDTSISRQGVSHSRLRPLFLLFNSTARKYRLLKESQAGFLDATLIEMRLDELAERGEKVRQLNSDLFEAVEIVYRRPR